MSPLLALLTMGITPHKLALTFALGSVIGILPLFGPASLLCAFLGVRLKLNIPALLLVCYLMAPFHLLLYVPFIKMGIAIFGSSDFAFSYEQIVSLLKQDWLMALNKIWLANLLGIVAWLIISAPLTATLYYVILPVLKKTMRKFSLDEVEVVSIN